VERYTIHWFRRDLRYAGNLALASNIQQYAGRVLGIFFIDPETLKRSDFSFNRFGFLLKTLMALKVELKSLGGDLLVLSVSPEVGFRLLHKKLSSAGLPVPEEVTFSGDYEPFALERDRQVTDLLQKGLGIRVRSERDHLLIEPGELLQKKGTPYRVYGPFAKKWFLRLHSEEIRTRLEKQKDGLRYLAGCLRERSQEPHFRLTWKQLFRGKNVGLVDELDRFIQGNSRKLSVPLPPAGSKAAYQTLDEFGKSGIEDYAGARDFPAVAGTSRLSIYLKNGSLTVPQVILFLELEKERFSSSGSRSRFLKELVWREFYYHILFHYPHVEHEAFNQKFRNIAWRNREKWFSAWKDGRTGYPIVDAGMRELRETGWMHNRVRMIVASFLTKDLQIDWRWGERYFMQQLLDGDLAANNGGWQWAASTGCDPQPYFRIFNPELQSRKFDPQGAYIRRFLPELAGLSDRQIHAPDDRSRPAAYPKRLVEHSEQRFSSLLLYEGYRNGARK